jgi:membrane protease YdiL (CAAX protease family)
MDEVRAKAGREAVDAALGDRALAAWEVVSITASVLIAEWLLAVSTGMIRLIAAIPVVLGFVLIISSQRLHRESLHEIGFRFDNFFRALKLLLLPMIVAAVLSLVLGIALGAKPSFLKWHSDRSIFLTLTIATGWGFLQHYVLQGFINRRARMIWGAGWPSIIMTATIFALLHLPNPTLVVLTFVGGMVWAAVYQRAPNLFALALSHAAMSWVIVATLPESMLNHSRIGLKYFF